MDKCPLGKKSEKTTKMTHIRLMDGRVWCVSLDLYNKIIDAVNQLTKEDTNETRP